MQKSKKEKSEMKNKLAVLVLTLTCIACFGLVTSSVIAETTASLDVKVVNYILSTSNFTAGDDPGHFIGTGQREGEASFSNGETARYSNVFTYDVYLGKALPSKGYTKFLFNDGSWFALSWECVTVMDKDGLPLSKGEGIIIKGDGRYKGIKGKAVFSGKEQKPAAQDPRRTAFMNATVNYTLP